LDSHMERSAWLPTGQSCFAEAHRVRPGVWRTDGPELLCRSAQSSPRHVLVFMFMLTSEGFWIGYKMIHARGIRVGIRGESKGNPGFIFGNPGF